ncbi:unannotated protein [freshwater metagenome]|uniref:Unannotated protein n=1 Tax=freshwater metagenome TaxID=449393 RepID=A0A6J6ZE24_9ZZZZ
MLEIVCPPKLIFPVPEPELAVEIIIFPVLQPELIFATPIPAVAGLPIRVTVEPEVVKLVFV